MRRLIILGLLFALMFILQFLQVEAETAFNAKSLATVGFILLAAYTLGEITGRFGLPKITGYIVTGLLFGPYVINLFSAEVVEDLKIINGLAIGLIALSAGGEMKVPSLRQIARSLTLIVVVKGGLILLMVMGAVYALSLLLPATLPFLAGASTPLVLAVGGLFGVLAIGTSPAATIAVINETGSRGRLADTTLGVAVFKDVVMVILLAVFIALTKVFATPDAVFDPHVLLVVGEELGLSILAGAVLGTVIIGYVRFLGAEMWLFVIAVIFVMNTFAELFHLEALLLFITAGFVVQNFSKHGDDFVHLIESVALPVYVVFFSVAGAGLNLGALAQVGLVAGVLVVVRLAAIFAGTRLATRWAGEPAAIQQNAWLSFVSQAGVVIGLTIIITNNLPGLGPPVQTVVLGTIAINLLAGPVLFKLALARVGETQEAREAAAPTAVEEPAEATTAPGAPALPAPEPPGEVAYPEPDFASPRLTAEAARLQQGLVRIEEDFRDQFLERETSTQRQFLERMRDRYHDSLDALQEELRREESTPLEQIHRLRTSRTTFARWLQSEAIAFGTRPERTDAAQTTFADLIRAVHDLCEDTEERFEVIQESERFEPTPDDSLYVRFRKALKRLGEEVSATLGSGVRDTRTVPFRRIVHYHLDGLLPADLVPVANQTGALPLFILDKTRILHRQIDEHYDAVIDRLRDEPEARPVLDNALFDRMREETDTDFTQALEDVERYGREMQQRLALGLVQRYAAVLGDLEGAGTFELPARARRFSLVYERSRAAQQAVQDGLDAWHDYTRGAAGSLAKHLDVVVLADQVERIVGETVVQVSDAIRERVGAHVETARQACAEMLDHLDRRFEEKPTNGTLDEYLAAQRQALLTTLDEQTLDPLEDLRESRLLNALLDRMLQRLSELADDVPATYEVIAPDDQPAPRQRTATPSTPRLKIAPMRQVTRTYLETRLARKLAEVNQTLFREVDTALNALTEVRHLVRFNLQAALDELEAPTSDDADHAEEVALDGLRRALGRLDQTRDQVEQFATEVHQQIQTSTDGLIEGLSSAIAGQSHFEMRLQRERRRALSSAATTFREVRTRLRDQLRLWILTARRRFRPLAEDLMRDLRAGMPLDDLAPDEILHRYDQAALDVAQVERLPFIYQKLFAFTPLETDEFLVGRQTEIETFALALRRWEAGTATSVAVVGEPGVGVSSFVHALRRTTDTVHPVRHVTFTQTPSSEEALARLLARRLQLPRAHTFDDLARLLRAGTGTESGPGRLVVFLEDAHYLYHRRPGGFDLLRGLLLLVATTGDRVCWVVTMNHHAWAYLDAVLDLADAFAFTLSLSPLKRADLEQAVLRRHRFSGLDLRFKPSSLMRQRRRYRRAADAAQQQMARTAFFDQLHRLSGGNPLAALFYWLKAIDTHQEHTLAIRPLDRPPFGYVRGLDAGALLTLKVLLQQGALTVDEHARLFGSDAPHSHATLMRLVHLNLVTRHDRTAPPTFRLHRPIYKPLARELDALNLLA